MTQGDLSRATNFIHGYARLALSYNLPFLETNPSVSFRAGVTGDSVDHVSQSNCIPQVSTTSGHTAFASFTFHQDTVALIASCSAGEDLLGLEVKGFICHPSS